ncbi:MAG: phasin [Rhodospirillaceae bacterium]|jgi:phasin family protein|uniref:phasin family protein n=1 Tax=unclassified Hwanghaeella TaxID=2605944 RepID=UPI000C49A98C|nr:phasin [Rhodospirillales bacterium]MAX48272.1 phasin [Rhodospirillaceae bacterium]|tara:strand:+ start:862 stop:1359 length:498 start_codon:yes stop_codon:yes gene_type:complete
MSKSPKSGFDPMNNPFMDPKTNPFLDPEKNPFLKGDFAKMFQGFEAPNMSGITDSQRKNMEALTVANKTAAEGVQAVIKRQSEIMKNTMDEANAALQELQSKGVSTPDTAASIDQVKNTIENSITNMRELSEMMAKSQAEAFDIVNKRFVESMDELKATMSKISK